jgi:hypothetical protein
MIQKTFQGQEVSILKRLVLGEEAVKMPEIKNKRKVFNVM